MLQALFDFYQSNEANPFILLAIYWLFWPGTMFWTAAILESRKVHLGKGQSRMFFPGDFMLGIGVISFIGINAKSGIDWEFLHSKNYWLATGAYFFVQALVIRLIDVKRYPKGSKNSPTKLAHDICGYWCCFWWNAALGIPAIAWAIKHPDTMKNCSTEWTAFACAALFFIAMTIYDLTHPATEEDLVLMHPPVHKPIWK